MSDERDPKRKLSRRQRRRLLRANVDPVAEAHKKYLLQAADLEDIGEHERWMDIALEEAKIAADIGEVPVGAIAVYEDEIIARGHNLRQKLQSPSAHAEFLAMEAAAKHLGSWRLIDVSIYVTLEPCPMCAGTMVNARLSNVIWGAKDAKAGAIESLYSLTADHRLNHRVTSISGVREAECAGVLQDFFRKIREARAKQKLK